MLNYENQLNLGNIYSDSLLILILNFSSELRQFCGIDKVPDASKWTRFKQDFCDYLKDMFIALVDVTEPICQAINPTLAKSRQGKVLRSMVEYGYLSQEEADKVLNK